MSIIFIAKILKRHFQDLTQKFKFFLRTGIVLPAGCSVGGLANIKIGKDFGMSSACKILATPHQAHVSSVLIGDNVKLNNNVMINADVGGKITIEDHCIIGPNCVIRSSNHKVPGDQSLIIESGHESGEITLGRGAWLGANVVVLPNVRIGQGAVIGAGAVVTEDIPDWAVAVGVPAKVKSVRC